MEHRSKYISLLLFFVLAAGFQACYYDNEEELYPPPPGGCDIPDTVTFSGDIHAITATRCAISGCHTGINPTGGLRLDSYSQVKSIATSGDLTLRTVVMEDMPPTGPLSDCEQELIQKWVNQGAPEF